MNGRRNNGHIVLGFCAGAGLLLLAGCESPRNEPDHQWIPIARSPDVTVAHHAANPPLPGSSKPRHALDLVSPSPVSKYDQAFVDAVEQRWDDILDHGSFAFTKGLVVLRFNLTADGNIADLQVVKNTSSEKAMAVCRRAIQESAPFPAWPPEMRRMVGDKREITFTFRYE